MPHGENGGTITISTTDGTASQPGDYGALSQSHTLASADFSAVTVGSHQSLPGDLRKHGQHR